MQGTVITSLPCSTLTAACRPWQRWAAALIMHVGGRFRKSTQTHTRTHTYSRFNMLWKLPAGMQRGSSVGGLQIVSVRLFIPYSCGTFWGRLREGRTHTHTNVYINVLAGSLATVVTLITTERVRGWACVLTNERICWMSSSSEKKKNNEKMKRGEKKKEKKYRAQSEIYRSTSIKISSIYFDMQQTFVGAVYCRECGDTIHVTIRGTDTIYCDTISMTMYWVVFKQKYN